MVFSSPVFLFAFLPIALGIYFATPARWRNPVLVVLSALFYIWGGGAFFGLMVASALFDYAIAVGVHRRVQGVGAKPVDVRVLVGISVAVNVGLLFWFKYAGLAAQIFNRIGDPLGIDAIGVPTVLLPLAISFFTFQRMSFTFDVAAGKIKELPSFLDYLLFGLLFPHLIAGPIVRYLDIEDSDPCGDRSSSAQ